MRSHWHSIVVRCLGGYEDDVLVLLQARWPEEAGAFVGNSWLGVRVVRPLQVMTSL